MYPERNIKTFLAHAEKHGAKILENSRVVNWTEHDNGVRILLEDGSIVEADKVIISAGSYTNHLVNNLGVHLKTSR